MQKIQEGGNYQPRATRSMWVLPYVWEEVEDSNKVFPNPQNKIINRDSVTQQTKLRKVYKNEWILLTTIARE